MKSVYENSRHGEGEIAKANVKSGYLSTKGAPYHKSLPRMNMLTLT